MGKKAQLSIIGTGNIGRAIAVGLAGAGRFRSGEIILTRRKVERLEDLAGEGFQIQEDNRDAVRRAEIVIIAVPPQELDEVLQEIGPELDADRHVLISVVSGACIADLQRQTSDGLPVARAMPNTGIAVGRSMTCVATSSDGEDLRRKVVSLFDCVGRTLVIEEELMTPATALGACGVAFFLRAVRAAAQGGPRGPDRARRRVADPGEGASPGARDRHRHHPAWVHHRRSERDGAPGLQLGDDQGHHDLGGKGRVALRRRQKVTHLGDPLPPGQALRPIM
jgi:pyrroline-5-carboxylate reductase